MKLRNGLRVVVALAIAVLASGCDGGDDSGLTRQITTTGQFQSLQLMATSRAEYERGAPIDVTLTVTNTGTQPVEYSYAGCEEYFGSVTLNGEQIATLPRCRGCTGNEKEATIAAGETRTFTMTWEQKRGIGCAQLGAAVERGTYAIEAGLGFYQYTGPLDEQGNPISQVLRLPALNVFIR